MILVWAGAMNSKLNRRSARFVFRLATTLCASFFLINATVTAAQTQDYPPLSKSMLGQISGRVSRSDTGEPLPKAQVELYPANPNTAEAAGPERIVRTGTDGTFVFPDLPAGTYGISVSRNGFSEFPPQQEDHGNQFITLKPGEKLEGLLLRLHPTGAIAGHVSDEDGEAVQGLEVFALRVNFQPGGRKQVSAFAQAVTDDLGNFRLPNLPPGSYYVSAGGLIQHPMGAVGLKQSPTGGVQYRNTFYPGTSSLDEAQVLRVGPELTTNDIRFTVPTERNYTITGKVLTGVGGPKLKDAEVSCKSVDAGAYTFGSAGETVQMEPDRSFKFSSLPPGNYTLSVSTVNAGVANELGFASIRVMDSNVHADIELGRAAEVHGTVDTSQGVSLAGKRITLEIFASGFYLLHESPGIDPDGRFAVTNIAPGEFIFTVSDAHGEESAYVKKAICDGRDYASREFTLAVGTVLDCDVTLAGDTGTVHGKVTDGENPAPGLVVVLVPESMQLRRIPRYTLTAHTDVTGQYKIAGVIPGDYLMFAEPPNADHGYFSLDFPERHTDIAAHVSVDPTTTQAVNLRFSKVEQ
jgi:carboxypeptidase family protein